MFPSFLPSRTEQNPPPPEKFPRSRWRHKDKPLKSHVYFFTCPTWQFSNSSYLVLAPHFLSSSIRQRYRRSHRHGLLVRHLPTPQLQTCSRSFRPFNNQRQGRGKVFFLERDHLPRQNCLIWTRGPIPIFSLSRYTGLETGLRPGSPVRKSFSDPYSY